MDQARTHRRFAPWHRAHFRWALLAAVLALLLAALAWRLQTPPTELSADARTVTLATVEEGPLDVNLRASGVLLPSEVRWVAAQSDGRIERVGVQPGAAVKAGEVLIQLSNPALQQRADDSHSRVAQAEAELQALRLSLQSTELGQQAAVQRAEFAAQNARLQLEADQDLLKDGMVSKLAYQRSVFSAQQSEQTLVLERQLLAQSRASRRAQEDAKLAALANLRKALQHELDLVAALVVRAPMDGTVQELNGQAGQSITSGANLAKLAQADALYAELQVQEAMARDIAAGQPVQIDLRTGNSDGQVAGVVARVAPKVSNGAVRVDVNLHGTLPHGAKPDLSVDGTISLTRLPRTLQVQRPVFSQAQSTATVFRLTPSGVAERVPVRFGAASVSRIAIASGLQTGDRIVISDTSAWQNVNRVRLR